MFESLISGPQTLAEILAALPPSPPATAAIERQVSDQSFDDWLKVSIYNSRQEERVAALRCDLTAVLGQRLDEEIAVWLSDYRLSEASQKKYAQDTRRFRAWCVEVGVPFLPAAPETIATFLFDQCAGGEWPKVAMMSRLCTALKLWHLVKGFPDPTDSPYVRAVRRLIKECSPQSSEPAPAIKPPEQSN